MAKCIKHANDHQIGDGEAGVVRSARDPDGRADTAPDVGHGDDETCVLQGYPPKGP